MTYAQPLSAMAEQQQVKAQLEYYNTHASLLYEQAFFLELLSAIIASRRYDDLNADITLAHSTITSRVESSIEHHELPFDDDVPPHEIFSLSNIYYVCTYLINQKSFNKLFSELPFIAQNQEVNLLAHIVALLSAFVELQKTNTRGCLKFLHNHTTQFADIIQSYLSACVSLRNTYTEYVRLIREQAVYYENVTQYVFHKYINPQQKILPLLLDSNVEPVLYAPVTTGHVIPIYEYEQETASPQPTKKRRSEDSTQDIPVMQFVPCVPNVLRNYCDIFAAYDYQEYMAAHICHVLEKPNELPLFLQDFFSSYYKNNDTLQYVFTRIEQEPVNPITDSLIPLRKICNILHHIQEKPTSTLLYFQDLKVILEKHYQGRAPHTL